MVLEWIEKRKISGKESELNNSQTFGFCHRLATITDV
jgi:hypothetical protein